MATIVEEYARNFNLDPIETKGDDPSGVSLFISMEKQEASPNHHFEAYLKGGGEMGEITRNFDWSTTSIGSPLQWPQSLLTTLGTILHSKFPMFLFWGPEHLCFYNDAYRPSLGNNGKHPGALGKKGEEVWPEIWKDIKPLIDFVLSENEGTWSEDQLLPIWRNGVIEDVYWTFSYSPVIGETGFPIAVFVTCVETTATVKNSKNIRESEQSFRNLIKNATVGIIVLKGVELFVDIVNDMYCRLIHKQYDEVIGKRIFDVIPEAEEYFKEIIYKVRTTGEPVYLYDNPYFVFDNGIKKEGFINVVYQPFKEADGAITGVTILVHDVTEQVLARQKVEMSREELRLALEIGHLATFNIDITTGQANYSDRLKDWFNLKEETDAINVIASKVHPDDYAVFLKAVTPGFNNTYTRHDIIYRVAQPNYDGYRHLHSVGEVQYVNGSPAFIRGIVQDVTEAVSGQRNLEDKELKLRSIIESSPFPIGVYVGKEMVIEFANKSIIEIYGKGDNVIGKSYKEVLPELENQEIFDQLDRVLQTGIQYNARNQKVEIVEDVKIKTYYFNYSFTPIRDASGTPYGVINTAADVTDLIVAKQKVEESEERFRTMAEGSQVLIAISDETTNAIYFNNAWIEFTGRRVEDLLQYGWADLIHSDDKDRIVNLYLNAFEKREPFTAEFRIQNKEGEYRWLLLKAFVRITPDTPFAGYISSSIDITEQKEFAEALENKVAERTRELAEANIKLQRSNIELNQFAYIASHDLQEPLRKVRTFTELMESNLDVIPEKAKIYIDKIKSSSGRMQSLIDDVLKFSLLLKQTEQLSQVKMKEIVQDILVDLELLIEQKAAKIQTGQLPVIEAISIQMRQLIHNLISNSLKFNVQDRPIEISINASILSKKDVLKYEELDSSRLHYKFEFKDNGIGFNQENADQIFAMFQRLHGRLQYEGTGIGLALCKKIVQNHRGVIYAKSALNSGATFIFILPQNQQG